MTTPEQTSNQQTNSETPPEHWEEWALEHARELVRESNTSTKQQRQAVEKMQSLLLAAMRFAAPDVKAKPLPAEKTTADYAFDSAMMQMQGMYALMMEYGIPAGRAANCAAHVESAIRTLHRESCLANSAERDINAKDAERHRYARATTTAVRDPETGESIEVTPEMYDAAIDSAIAGDPERCIGIKSSHMADLRAVYTSTSYQNDVEQHPAFITVMDDILTPQGWEKYKNGDLISLDCDCIRDIFIAGLSTQVARMTPVEHSLNEHIPHIITPGCWIETAHGEAVCVTVEGTYVGYRYSAKRVSDNADIWVANGASLQEVRWLRGRDVISHNVCAMKGPYGDA